MKSQGDRELLEHLASRSPSENLPLMLEIARQQAERRTPADLNAQLARDGFVAPSPLDLRTAHRLDGIALDAAADFEALLLSPLAPLGTCAAVSPSSQHRIVSTMRGTEVVSDPTNMLALECARRLGKDRSAVRLATIHQVVRAQRFADRPGFAQHFKMLALVTAGPALADHAFEVLAMLEQLKVCLRVMDAWESHGARLGNRRASVLVAPGGRPIADRLLRELSRVPGLAVEEGDLASGYYDGVRMLWGADDASGMHVNLGDTGLFDWVAKLTSNRRMRMVASGMGLQLVPLRFGRR